MWCNRSQGLQPLQLHPSLLHSRLLPLSRHHGHPSMFLSLPHNVPHVWTAAATGYSSWTSCVACVPGPPPSVPAVARHMQAGMSAGMSAGIQASPASCALHWASCHQALPPWTSKAACSGAPCHSLTFHFRSQVSRSRTPACSCHLVPRWQCCSQNHLPECEDYWGNRGSPGCHASAPGGLVTVCGAGACLCMQSCGVQLACATGCSGAVARDGAVADLHSSWVQGSYAGSAPDHMATAGGLVAFGPGSCVAATATCVQGCYCGFVAWRGGAGRCMSGPAAVPATASWMGSEHRRLGLFWWWGRGATKAARSC